MAFSGLWTRCYDVHSALSISDIVLPDIMYIIMFSTHQEMLSHSEA